MLLVLVGWTLVAMNCLTVLFLFLGRLLSPTMDGAMLCGTYKVINIDGNACSEEAFVAVETTNDGVKVEAMVGNTLCGKGVVDGGRITANLASTMKLVEDRKMRIEDLLICGFRSGFAYEINDMGLTLTGTKGTLILERDVLSDVQFGEYTLCEFNGKPLTSDEMSLVLLPAVIGGALVIAQFKNSFRGELELRSGRLQGVLASTMFEVDGFVKTMEDAFVSSTCGNGIVAHYDMSKLVLMDGRNRFVYELRPAIPDELVCQYMLKSFNGASVVSNNQLLLRFARSANGVGADVVANVANIIRGKVRVDGGKLMSKVMSSRKRGSEEEMRLEAALTCGFKDGFAWSLDDGVLTLEHTGNVLVFVKMAEVPCENGKPAYIGDKVTKCFKVHENGRIYRIVNTVEGRWAFYNDTTAYHFHVSVTFGRASEVTGLGNTTLRTNAEGLTVASVSVPPGGTEMLCVLVVG
ncbi:unnamed protein product, partial [Trypanosoma congolense IL3000]